MTANAISGMREIFLQNGFNDFLSKPVEILRIDEIVRKWIPKEKLLKASKEERHEETPLTLEIEGVDIAVGIASVGGLQARYLELLEIFRRDVVARLDYLRTPDEAARDAFITQVHALKSGLANIGARELSSLAALLEKAGRDGDMEAIQAHIDGFRESLEALQARIGAVLTNLHLKDDKPSRTGQGRETLIRLQTALQSGYIDAIDGTMQDMKVLPLSPDMFEAVADIEELVLVGDFKEAEALVQKLLVLRSWSDI